MIGLDPWKRATRPSPLAASKLDWWPRLDWNGWPPSLESACAVVWSHYCRSRRHIIRSIIEGLMLGITLHPSRWRAYSRDWVFCSAFHAILCLSLGFGLAACTQPVPPSAKTIAPTPPATPAEPKQATIVKHEAIWSFETSDVQCTARAADSVLSLSIIVQRNENIFIKFIDHSHKETGSHTRVTYLLRFQSNKEHWSITAKGNGYYLVGTELPLNDEYMSRMLILLGGGVLTKIERGHILANLHIPPADAQGQKWFDCVREKSL